MKKQLPLSVILLVLNFTFTTLHAQDFITEWDLDPGETTLDIVVKTAGLVTYSWSTAPSGNSDTGNFDQSSLGIVTIPNLIINAGDVLTLNIEPANFREIRSGNSAPKLLDVTQWGAVPWDRLDFSNSTQLNITATDIPDLTNVSSMSGMFEACEMLNGPSNIGSWNTSNVNNMKELFLNANSFNQDIGSWNVSNVDDMNAMFQSASNFNQDIGGWNTANVEDMNSTFSSAIAFDQDLNSWNTINVEDMSTMFFDARVFNGDVSSWNTANVAEMRSMFNRAALFNQDIGSWNVSSVTRADGMFFQANAFNQDIGSWNVSLMLIMSSMFSNAPSFNQDISSWDVSNVSIMSNMFLNATAFDQDLGDWILRPSVSLLNFFNNSGMSCENYSSTLIGWQANNPTVTNRSLGATNLEYGTDAVPARDLLVNTQNWNISGDIALGADCLMSLPVTWASPLTAQDHNSVIQLDFSVANQINNDYFKIERSSDGSTFETIEMITGEIDLPNLKHYSVLDRQPFTGNIYYRVTQVDLNGNYSHSNIATVERRQQASNISVYPNPATDQFFIDSEKQGNLTIYSAFGRAVLSQPIDIGQNEVRLSNLYPGIYLIEIDGLVLDKIIIQ